MEQSVNLNSQSKISKLKLTPKKLMLVFIALVLAATGGYGLFRQLHQPLAYKYKKADTLHILNGSAGNDGLSFLRPHELAQFSSNTGQVEFQHLIGPQTGKKFAAYASAGISPNAQTLSETDFKNLNLVLSRTTDVYYLQATSAIRAFVADRLPQDGNVTYADAKAFTNANIKSNAWQFGLSVKTKTGKTLKGTSIYSVGNKGYYFFMILTPDYNWQANQTIWNQVLNSLKADQ